MLSFLRSGKFWFKATVYVLGTLSVLTVVGQMILFFLFDHARVRAAVDEAFGKSGYTVHFEDHIGRSWFPAPNINLYRVRLDPKPYENAPPFTAERVNVRLSYLSLFGAVKIAKITLAEPEINAVRLTDGSWNTDVLFTADGMRQGALPERVMVRGGTVNISDENTAARYRLTAVNLDYDHIHDDATLQADARLSEGFSYATAFSLNTQVLKHGNDYTLQNVTGTVSAELPRIGATNAIWKTPQIRWQRHSHLLNTGTLDINGHANQHQLSFDIAVSGIDADIGRDVAQTLEMDGLVHWQDKDASWDSSLNLNSIVRHGATLRIGAAKYELTRKSPAYVQVATVRSSVQADLDRMLLQLRDASVSSVQTEAEGAHPLWQSELTGNINYAHNQFFNADLQGMFDRQPVTVEVRHNAVDKPEVWTGKVNLRALDLTPYLTIHSDHTLVPQKLNATFTAAEKWLNRLNNQKIQTVVHINKLNIDGWQMDALSSMVYADRSGMVWEQVRADMYGGTIEGSLAMANTTPRSYRIDQMLYHINMRDWLSDWMDYPYLDGIGNVQIQIGLSGNTAAELAASMNGNTLVNVNDGTIRGIDMGDLLKNSENLSETLSAQAFGFNRHTRTEFRFFTVHTRWVDGIGYTPLIAFGSDHINVSGQGRFNLNDKTMDYALSVSGKLNSGKKSAAVNLPLRISGSIKRPVYALDYAAITRDMKHETDKQKAVREVLQQQWQLLQ